MRASRSEIERVVGRWVNPDDAREITNAVLDLIPPVPDMLHDAVKMAETGNPRICVQNALAVYQAAASAIDRYERVKEAARQVISDVIVETGTLKWTTAAGSASVAKPGTTVTYDAKGLDSLMEKDPAAWAVLSSFRREKPRDGSLVIRPPSTASLPDEPVNAEDE